MIGRNRNTDFQSLEAIGVRSKSRRRFIAALAFIPFFAIGALAANRNGEAKSAAHKAKPGELRVLFVGNSFSFDVPREFADLCRQNGRKVFVDQETPGGWNFAKHAQNGSMKRFSEGWDFIVLQGQSQETSFSEAQMRRDSLPPASDLVAAIRKAGAKPLFYETWGYREGDTKNKPEDDFAKMSERIIAGYAMLAKETGADIAPVGQTWQLVRTRKPDINLYVDDGHHPSAAGIQLAASVFYATIFKADPTVLRGSGGVPPATAKVLREAARDAALPKP